MSGQMDCEKLVGCNGLESARGLKAVGWKDSW